jgi:hypothetical protein
MLHHVVMIEHRQPKILEVIGAAGSPRRFPGGLNRWQQEGDQYADDRDDNQQLNESEPSPLWSGG